MMSLLFSVLLVPIFPQLDSPHLVHGPSVLEIEERLRQETAQAAGVVPNVLVGMADETLRLSPPQLPPITGRIFGWSSSRAVKEAMELAEIGRSASALRYTGMIESAGQKAGILSDGQNQYVVGVGSYVLGHYKVLSMNKAEIVLMPLDGRSGSRNLELNLVGEVGVRGS